MRNVLALLLRCRFSLLMLLTGGGAVAAFQFYKKNRVIMLWLARHIAVPYRRGFSALVNALPFSFAELLCGILGAGVLIFLVGGIRLQLAGQNVLLPRLIGIAALAVWIYAGVCLFWGVQYYCPTFAEQAGMSVQGATVDELEATAIFFREQANAAAEQVNRDENNCYSDNWQQILANSAGLYQGIETEYPFLAGPERRPKPAVISYIMSLANFTGFLFPFTGEANLNVVCPTVFIPVTVAHEFSHQRGVAAEQEANFVGIEAAITSGKPEYEYSAWLFGYLHLTNALYEADQQRYWAVEAGLCDKAKADMDVNNVYWTKYEKKTVAKVMTTTYETFLAAYDQPLGMRSYGACVDLLVAKYCPYEQVKQQQYQQKAAAFRNYYAFQH